MNQIESLFWLAADPCPASGPPLLRRKQSSTQSSQWRVDWFFLWLAALPLGFTFNQHFSFRLIDSITFINRRSRRKVWFHSFLIAFVGLVLGLLLFAEHWRVAPPITPQRQPIQTNQLQWNETIQTKTKVFLFIHSFPWALNGRQFSFLSSARPLGRASWKKKRNWMAQRSQPTHFFHSFNNWFH